MQQDPRKAILLMLRQAEERGIDQSELQGRTGYSKSRLSEILTSLEREGRIVRQTTGGKKKRVWLKGFEPNAEKPIIRVGYLRSSEYIPILSAIWEVARDTGTAFSMRVYDSPIEISMDVSRGALEMGLAPTVTQFLVAVVTSQTRILMPVATGGASVLENTSSPQWRLATSEMSSMMVLARAYSVAQRLEMVSFSSPVEALQGFTGGSARYIAIWEPYRTVALSRPGVREVARFSDILDSYPCCVLSVQREFTKGHMNVLRRIKEIYRDFQAQAGERFAASVLSRMRRDTGVDERTLLRSLASYRFLKEIDMEQIFSYMAYTGVPIGRDMITDSIIRI
ncbi:hypothetical protein [Thermogymnomonas acidicola]|uniref:hypothetical protein n=1 Tax=Thermogymnomonas acidicola TaxID=399579 RepID=UPI00166D932B|nr:hypothetical protein [Thermogymnomonas acidicola]